MGSAQRNHALDSLRGLAALGVCIRHSEEFLPNDGVEYFSRPLNDLPLAFWAFRLLDSILNPYTAVIFFFVLSGYVLAGAIERSSSWRSYAVRRLWRLYPPLIVSVIVSWIAIVVFMGHWRPGVDAPFARQMFGWAVGWRDIGGNMLLLGTSVNKVTWTVRVELWGSLLLPAVMSLGRRIRPELVLLGLVSFTAIPNLLPNAQHTLSTVLGADFYSVQLLYCFAFGAYISGRPLPQNWSAGWTMAVSWIVLIAVAEWPPDGWLRDMIITVAACGVIASTARKPFAFLSLLPFVTLGEISYSLYLLHPPVLYACFVLATWLQVSGAPGSWFLICSSLILAAPVAMLSRRYIELPSMALGRKWSRPRAPVVAVVSSGEA